jgi:hypothetical protein
VQAPHNEFGQLSLRQDLLHWSFNDEGKPQPFGGIVLDCVRMTLHDFWLTSTALTETERLYAQLPHHLQPQEITKKLGTQAFVDDYMAHSLELGFIRERERKANEIEEYQLRPFRHRFKR